MLIWICVGVAFIVGSLCPLVFKKNDSVIEEACEAYIKSQTGKDVDFSLESAESE